MRYFLRLRDFARTFPNFALALTFVAFSMAVAAEENAAAKLDAVAENAGPSPALAKRVAPNSQLILLEAQLRLGNGLIAKLSADTSEPRNVIVSPASLAMVFSMLDLGADDQMRTAIRKTLGFRAAKGVPKGELENLRAIANSVQEQARDSGPLALANMIVFETASKAYPEAIQKLKTAGADVQEEDLSRPESIARINAWVKEKTRGLIPSVIEQTPQEAGLVAVNAIYFKDRWKQPFDPAATRNEKFHIARDQSKDVPMMHSEGRMAFRQNNKFIAAALSYASSDYELVVLTSKDEPVGVNEFAEVVGWLGGQGFDMSEGEISLPRFSASGREDLLPAIDELGLGKARRAAGALGGFSATSQVISRVVQIAELRVNEEGTEAAAATAVTTLRSAAPRQFVKMIVDKPFVFTLRDRRTGLVLLQGYVAKPATAAETTEN